MQYITDINQLDFSKTYTYADYLLWKFKERVEIIKGKLFKMSPAPNADHQEISMKISSDIYQFIKDKSCKVFSAPFDVRLPVNDETNKSEDKLNNVVQPDICVICDSTKIDERGCKGAPDLIVEIVSKSSVQKDLHEKYDLYEEAGVQEYWIVHPKDSTLNIFVLNDKGKYQPLKLLTYGDIARSRVLPGLEIDLKELFPSVAEEPVEPYGPNVRRI